MKKQTHLTSAELPEPIPDADTTASENPPRKHINLDDFPEDCGGYGVDDKPRTQQPRY